MNGIKPDGKRKFPDAPPGTYCGAGHNNNYCFVIPEWNMVIVRPWTRRLGRRLGVERVSRESR